jgi:hypothetical protein
MQGGFSQLYARLGLFGSFFIDHKNVDFRSAPGRTPGRTDAGREGNFDIAELAKMLSSDPRRAQNN